MKIIKFLLISGISLGLMILLQGCATSREARPELGTSENPVKLFFTPSLDTAGISENADIFADYIKRLTGLAIQTSIPPNYDAVIEAFGSGMADVAVMNSFGYILAQQRHRVRARMTVMRYGERYYKGQIIARTDAGIDTPSDLDGKSVAFVDQSSISGFIFPLKLLQESGANPSRIVYARKHDEVVRMVYEGQVDGGATFYAAPSEDGEMRDARFWLLDEYPDIGEKVKILATTEKILNDPIVFAEAVPEHIEKQIIHAFVNFLETPEGRDVFMAIYSVDGVKPAVDADYNGLREALEIARLKPEDLL